jgi:hypothetical protein
MCMLTSWQYLRTTVSQPSKRIEQRIYKLVSKQVSKKVSDSIEQSTFEANSHFASQEIPHLLWKPYRVRKNPTPVPILSDTRPVHNFQSYFSKINYTIILPSTPRISKWSLLFRLSNQNFACISHLSHACYMYDPYHPPWFYHPSIILWSVNVMKFLIMNYSPASRQFHPLRSKCSPQHPVPKHLQSMFFP